MLGFFTSWWNEILVLLTTGLVLLYVHYKMVVAPYWKKRNVPHLPPKFLAGNFLATNFTENFAHSLEKYHRQMKGNKVIGIWFFQKPAIMALDVGTIKTMLIKDFNHFHDRGIDINEHVEPLSGNLFNLSGSKWRNLRVKLTPTFTSGKMKMMFPTMVDCGEKLQVFLEETVQDGDTVEIKDILARFTTDIISSCAFGIETNSLKNPDSEFRTFGKKIFAPSLYFVIINLLVFAFPIIDRIIWLRRMPKSVNDFFVNAVKETIQYREMNNTKRRDFLQLLVELKNKGYIDEADAKPEENEVSQEEQSQDKFTVEQAAAQAFVFFIAGFETSSTTMMFCFYELALNSDIQTRLQAEIDEVLERHNGEVTYEAVNEMEYLDWVVMEALRKYPPVPSLFRICTKSYTLPGTKTVIDKGTPVMISLLGLHMDPEIFPEPEKFEPKRFSHAEKSKRDSFFHLPFGEGPRVCIGNRFGLLQTKVGLVTILSKFNVGVSDKTPIPIEYDVKAFVLTPTHGMPLALSRR